MIRIKIKTGKKKHRIKSNQVFPNSFDRKNVYLYFIAKTPCKHYRIMKYICFAKDKNTICLCAHNVMGLCSYAIRVL
jgi:hypothetical protein